MSRRDSREIAVKIIFQYEFGGIDPQSVTSETVNHLIENYTDTCGSGEGSIDSSYLVGVVRGVLLNLDIIDKIIGEHAKDWKFERLAKSDISVLRVAVYEMKFRKDIPASVSINEAVDLAKKYGHEDSGSFVNGILGSVYESGV